MCYWMKQKTFPVSVTGGHYINSVVLTDLLCFVAEILNLNLTIYQVANRDGKTNGPWEQCSQKEMKEE